MFASFELERDGDMATRNGRSDNHQSDPPRPPRKYDVDGPGSAIQTGACVAPRSPSPFLSLEFNAKIRRFSRELWVPLGVSSSDVQ